MELEIIFEYGIGCWLYLCFAFSIIASIFGMVYLSVSFLIWATINLEGKIRTQKVWREAINLYKKKEKEKAIKADMKDCIWNENKTESEDKQ